MWPTLDPGKETGSHVRHIWLRPPMATYIALALTVDHPELVRSLVLGEPPVRPSTPGRNGLSAATLSCSWAAAVECHTSAKKLWA